MLAARVKPAPSPWPDWPRGSLWGNPPLSADAGKNTQHAGMSSLGRFGFHLNVMCRVSRRQNNKPFKGLSQESRARWCLIMSARSSSCVPPPPARPVIDVTTLPGPCISILCFGCGRLCTATENDVYDGLNVSYSSLRCCGTATNILQTTCVTGLLPMLGDMSAF